MVVIEVVVDDVVEVAADVVAMVVVDVVVVEHVTNAPVCNIFSHTPFTENQ